MLGLRFCARALRSCGEREPLLIAVRGPPTIAASLVAEHRLQTRRLSNCGSRAQLLRGMWDLPRPGLELVSPALAGRPSTTAPPGKPHVFSFYYASIFPVHFKRNKYHKPYLCFQNTPWSLRKHFGKFWIPWIPGQGIIGSAERGHRTELGDLGSSLILSLTCCWSFFTSLH